MVKVWNNMFSPFSSCLFMCVLQLDTEAADILNELQVKLSTVLDNFSAMFAKRYCSTQSTHIHAQYSIDVWGRSLHQTQTSFPLPPLSPVSTLGSTAACVRWLRSSTRSKDPPTTALQRQMLTPCWGPSWSSWMGSKSKHDTHMAPAASCCRREFLFLT